MKASKIGRAREAEAEIFPKHAVIERVHRASARCSVPVRMFRHYHMCRYLRCCHDQADPAVLLGPANGN